MVRTLIFFWITAILLNGCTTANSFEINYNLISYPDANNIKEAKLIDKDSPGALPDHLSVNQMRKK